MSDFDSGFVGMTVNVDGVDVATYSPTNPDAFSDIWGAVLEIAQARLGTNQNSVAVVFHLEEGSRMMEVQPKEGCDEFAITKGLCTGVAFGAEAR